MPFADDFPHERQYAVSVETATERGLLGHGILIRLQQRSGFGMAWLTGADLPDQSRKHVFHALDALRGVAAIAIVIRHSTFLFGNFNLPNSQLAVDLFFVLSGFVLAHAYGRRFEFGMTPLQFMKARAIRLFPLYLLGLVLAIAVLEAGGGRGGVVLSAANISSALLMLPSPSLAAGANLYPLNPPAWSLFFEIIANFAYAIIARQRVALARRMAIAILAISAVALACCAIVEDGIGSGYTWGAALSGFPRLGFSFTVGVLVYHLPRFKFRFPVAGICAALLLSFAFQPKGNLGIAYELACVIVVYPALVAVSASAMVGARMRRSCGVLGATSYGIYVLHKPIEWGVAGILRRVCRP